MKEELRDIKKTAAWAEAWYPVASAVQAACDYIAKLEERLETLEDRHRPRQSMEVPARGPRTAVIDGQETTE